MLDALTLFKRNVSLHFAGVTECAICYSIISVNDRSLPNRSCKTCDNTFHASCLYKVRPSAPARLKFGTALTFVGSPPAPVVQHEPHVVVPALPEPILRRPERVSN